MPVPGEFRRALRSLDRRRTFAATVVLTLTLAFSIPAVVLSTVDRHFWRPLDLVDSDWLFTLQIQLEDGRFSPLSHPDYAQLRDVGVDGFSLAAFGQFDFTLAAGGAPTRVEVALVSGNFSWCWERRRRTAGCWRRGTTTRAAPRQWSSCLTVPGRRTSAGTRALSGASCALDRRR